jgi:hypothetical protein
MKTYRVLIAGVVLGLAMTGCGSVTLTGASTPASATRAASGASARSSGAGQAPSAPAPSARSSPAVGAVLFDCLGHPLVEPATYVLTCADAGSVLARLVWTAWTARQAKATGVHELNDCTPNCAQGRFRDYPAVITLWRGEPVPGHPGERYFTRVTVRYTRPRPPAYMSYGRLIQRPAEWTQRLGLVAP